MREVMHTNIYDVKGKVLIYGTCLRDVEKTKFEELEKLFDESLSLCLEEEHINMAITKIGAMLSTGQISELCFASVNRSPHCTQLHYIKHEIERMIPKENLPPMMNVIIRDGKVYEISDDVIDYSKDLIELTKKLKENID